MAANTAWVFGQHAVQAVLQVNPERAVSLSVVIKPNNPVQAELLQQVKTLGIPVHAVDKRTLAKQCGAELHQGLGLQVRPRSEGNEKDLEHLVARLRESQRPALLLILDQVQDPHNFGACLRTADAAGVDAVIVAKDNASPMTPVVQKVASGAAETLAIFRVTNLSRTMDALKQQGVWMIGTSDKVDRSLYQESLQGALAIVMGGEGKGLRQLTERKCDTLVCLPMAGTVVSSLNVSVATGVCLYEVIRQRHGPAE